MKGMNKQPGFQPHIGFWHRLVMGMIYGDTLQQVLYRTRPYEKVKGTAEALFHKWQNKCMEDLKKRTALHSSKISATWSLNSTALI